MSAAVAGTPEATAAQASRFAKSTKAPAPPGPRRAAAAPPPAPKGKKAMPGCVDAGNDNVILIAELNACKRTITPQIWLRLLSTAHR